MVQRDGSPRATCRHLRLTWVNGSNALTPSRPMANQRIKQRISGRQIDSTFSLVCRYSMESSVNQAPMNVCKKAAPLGRFCGRHGRETARGSEEVAQCKPNDNFSILSLARLPL